MILSNFKSNTKGAAFIEALLALIVAGLGLTIVWYVWVKIEVADEKARARIAFSALRGQGVYISSSGITGNLPKSAVRESLSKMLRILNLNTFDGRKSLPVCLYAVQHEFDSSSTNCINPIASNLVASVNSNGEPCPLDPDGSPFQESISLNEVIEKSKRCIVGLSSCAHRSRYTWTGFLSNDDYSEMDIQTSACGILTEEGPEGPSFYFPYNPE